MAKELLLWSQNEKNNRCCACAVRLGLLLRLGAAGEMATDRYAADGILAFEELVRVAWRHA